MTLDTISNYLKSNVKLLRSMALTIKHIMIAIGIGLMIVGLGLNIGYPLVITADSYTINPNQTQVQLFQMNPSLIATSYTFKIQMTMANDTTNAFLVEFPNSSEYARYNANISLTDLIPIKVFDKTNDTTNYTIFADLSRWWQINLIIC